jgi:hypothetical protein
MILGLRQTFVSGKTHAIPRLPRFECCDKNVIVLRSKRRYQSERDMTSGWQAAKESSTVENFHNPSGHLWRSSKPAGDGLVVVAAAPSRHQHLRLVASPRRA